MLKLGPKQEEPLRITLRPAIPAQKAVYQGTGNSRKLVAPAIAGEPEAFVIMAPITRAMRRRSSRIVVAQLGGFADPTALDQDMISDAAEAGSLELIRLGIIDWGGIGDAQGEPIALTPDRETRFATANAADRPTGTIDLLLADEDAFAKIEDEYVRPDAQRRAEKNGLSASRNGTGGAGTPAKGIASLPANRRAKRAAAKSARTAKTRSKRKPAKTPGKR